MIFIEHISWSYLVVFGSVAQLVERMPLKH